MFEVFQISSINTLKRIAILKADQNRINRINRRENDIIKRMEEIYSLCFSLAWYFQFGRFLMSPHFSPMHSALVLFVFNQVTFLLYFFFLIDTNPWLGLKFFKLCQLLSQSFPFPSRAENMGHVLLLLQAQPLQRTRKMWS